ncbi:MAG TPA: DNA mismatch repair protein MutS [Acidobacteriaceae bacterium]
MRQYTAAKQQHPDALLFFRLGDFYELFYEDARTAARELQITLTARDREKAVPMCGVPFHAADAHIARLLRKGYRVAICEQMEDPKQTRKIVRREVTRVLTPGTAIDGTLAEEHNNYLAAMALHTDRAGLALLDLSTGEFRATEFAGAQAIALCADELARSAPAEILLPAGNPMLAAQDHDSGPLARAFERIRTKTPVDDWVFTRDYALPLLERQLGAHSLDGFGVADHPLAAIAAGVLLHYAQATQKQQLSHIDSLRFYERADCLQLDQVTVRNLELVDPLFRDAGSEATLFHALDCCRTPMGKRLLRSTILRPLLDPAAIACRYQAVGELHRDLIEREELRRALGAVLDLERLLARVSLDSAGPRDLLALSASLRALPLVCAVLLRRQAPLWRSLLAKVDALEDLSQSIDEAILPEPAATLAEGGVIRPGIHAELDDLRATSQSGRTAIAAIEERERTRTGVASLKVRYTSVFGYYIELTRSNLRHVPADYERKQTLVNAERFTTPELKEYEQKILTAHERSLEIEKQLFATLRGQVLAAGSRIRTTSTALAELDLLANFAHVAAERRYVEPSLDLEGSILEVAAGRHPVIEHMMERSGVERFVPNAIYLDDQTASLLLITGPNMGGKSTYLRQAAMLVLMAQMGSFVPADRMRFTPTDRIYTRIGASDNVARGRSTFMVEMTETATILNTATAQSLVLLDEMGRGTATYDGLSLAWATLEHLHNEIHARTLFATHYHELTLLAEPLPRLRNLRVSVRETPERIVFLHTVEPGAASKSYGIEVARLAGLPQRVIARARQVLRLHEKAERQATAEALGAPLQLTIFTPLSQRILDRLHATEVDSLTPLQALNLLSELKQEIGSSRG